MDHASASTASDPATQRVPTARSTWSVAFAGGDGTRLAALARDARGTPIPKQYWSLRGGPTLIEDALRRTREIAPPERVVAVVAAHHRRWWQRALRELDPGNVVVQSVNRGTAIGVLLATLHVAGRDPTARVVFLPCDHYVRDEPTFAAALRAAAALPLPSGHLVLLGLVPESPDPELGYVLADGTAAPGVPRNVRRFVEKPAPADARALLGAGALWNSFVFAADVATLLGLIRRRYPEIVDDLETAWRRGPEAVHETLEAIPALDFSKDVLQGAESSLRVLGVPPCGWTDLGTPRRVIECLERLRASEVAEATPAPAPRRTLLAAWQRAGFGDPLEA